MQTRGVGKSVTGTARDFNEDSFLIDDELGFYVLSDGIGGRACGEIASAVTVRSLAHFLSDHEEQVVAARNGKVDKESIVQLAESAVLYACQELQRHIDTHRDCSVMGSTMTMVIVLDNKAVMAHVGNTRLYLYRNGAVHQLSNDHTIAAEYLRKGIIGEEEVVGHPYEKVLTRALGRQPSVIVETLLFDILPLDRLLLCSNGLRLPVDRPDLIGDVFREDIADTPQRLIELALQEKNDDDATVVIIQPGVSAEDDLKPQLTSFMPDSYFDLLGSVRIFEDLSLSQLQRIRNISQTFYFEPGEHIVKQGERAAGMYLVLEGSVETSLNGKKYSELRAGDTALENMLLNAHPAGVTLKAREATRVLLLERNEFEKFAKQFPRIGVALMNSIAERLADELERSRG